MEKCHKIVEEDKIVAFSSSEGKKFFSDWLEHVAKPLNFKNFLDVGVGSGWYGKLIREVFARDVTIDGVEIYEPFVERHGLRDIYNRLFIEDVRKMAISKLYPYDLVTTGDVIEHMYKEEIVSVLNALKEKARFIWCALPIKVENRIWSTGYKQGEDEWKENVCEKHLHDWGFSEFRETFNPLFGWAYIQTGMFLIEGKIK